MYYFNRGREAGFRAHWLHEFVKFEDVHKPEKTDRVIARYMAVTRRHIPGDLWQDTPVGKRTLVYVVNQIFLNFWLSGYRTGEFMWFVRAMPFLPLFYEKRDVPKAYYEWLRSI